MNVKLIVIEGHGSEPRPFVGGTDKVTQDLVLKPKETVRGVVYTDFDMEDDGSYRVNDELLPVITISHINNLNARIFSVVDAVFTDKQQHDAVRDMLRDVTWSWYTGHLDALSDTWRKQPDEDKNTKH